MINKEEIAVCISGLARENYKFALKNIHIDIITTQAAVFEYIQSNR